MTKKLLSINLGNFGSTGRIMRAISEMAEKEGYTTLLAYPSAKNNLKMKSNEYLICSDLLKRISQRLGWITGLNGCYSFFATKRFLKKVDQYKPDIIHLHNLHNGYINLPLLFNYIKRNNIQIVWTLHDCWSFTGGCPHFTEINCNFFFFRNTVA